MDLIHNLSIGFGVAFTFTNLLYCLLGCILGTLIGVLPGIGPVATIAMLLPATYALPPVSALIMFQAMVVESADGDKIGKWAWKPLAFVLGANLAFGVLLGGLPSIGLPAMGMIIAIYALTIISSMAGEHFKLRDVLILSTILAAGSYVAFIWALKLQIQVWPTFISG